MIGLSIIQLKPRKEGIRSHDVQGAVIGLSIIQLEPRKEGIRSRDVQAVKLTVLIG